MARLAAAAACSAAVLLLAVSFYAAGEPTGPLTAMQEADLAGVEETSNLLPAHRDSDEEVGEDIKDGRRRGATAAGVASLASAEEESIIGKEAGSDGGKPKKLDDKNDSDSDSDDGSGSDSDLDSDSGSDSDSDSDDDDEDHNSKHGNKKHLAPGRKGAPGGQDDDEPPKMVIEM